MASQEKNLASLLQARAGKMSPTEETDEAEGTESESEEGEYEGVDQVASELASAIEAKDGAGIQDAIRALYDLCRSGEG